MKKTARLVKTAFNDFDLYKDPKMKEENLKKTDKDLFEEELPIELKAYIFRFFTQKELKKMASVSQQFKQLSDGEIKRLKNEYKDNIFYTIGNPIRFSDDKNRGFFDMDVQIKFRKEIPLREIYESFVGEKIEQLRLFKTENEALEYALFLRTGSDFGTEDFFQPAVFKVIYLKKLDEFNIKNEDLILHKGQAAKTVRNGEWVKIYNETERTSKVEYYEAQRMEVIPLEGFFKIHLDDKGDFQVYKSINYDNLNLNEEGSEDNKSSSYCIIC